MPSRPSAMLPVLLLPLLGSLLGCAGDEGPAPVAERAEAGPASAGVLAFPVPSRSPDELMALARAISAREDLFSPPSAPDAGPDPSSPAPEPAPALASGPPPGGTLPGWPLTGRVRHGEEGVAGVTVHLVGAGGEAASAVTGPDGAYAFASVLPGEWLLFPEFGGEAVEPPEAPVTVSGPVEAADFSVPSLLWHVDASARALTRDGMGWGTALLHPQEAADRADSGDAILVARGTYFPQAPLGPVLRMKPGVAVLGGFAGYETGGLRSRDRQAGASVLDGLGSAGHVVLGASRARLDGFTITRGRALPGDGGSAGQGGGMRNEEVAGLTVASCVFLDNDAAGTGGAVHNLRSTGVLFDHCLFTGNIASWGGAVANGACGEGVRFVNCTFARNAGSEGAGAALLDDAVSSSFANCLVWGNHPPDGLPILRTGDNPLVDVTFTDIDSSLYPGPGNRSLDPCFADPDARDFRLLPGSPCLDAGSFEALAGSADAAGAPVSVDGDGDGTAFPDLGAFERGRGSP